VRTDSGYRFGSFHGAAFIEPLAIIAVNCAEIDGFTLGGNEVSFGDDRDARGRLGLMGRDQRAGLDRHHHGAVRDRQPVGQSLHDNKGTLVSTGASFTLKDGEHRGRCSLQQFVGG